LGPVQEEDILIFHKLGLTPNQTKAYLALVNRGTAKASIISQLSGVPRGKIYEILTQLEKKGLVSRLIQKPTKFCCIPLDECVSMLTSQKNREHEKLLKKTTMMLNKYTKSPSPMETTYEFRIIPVKKYNERIRKEICENLSHIFKVVTSGKRFYQAIFFSGNYLSEALERGVKIRYIMNIPENDIVEQESVKHIMEHPNFDCRYVNSSPESLFSICDDREAYIVTSPEEDLLNSPLLSTTNMPLISLIRNYFEIMWITALETPQYHVDSS
jgi:sugar-specific transcriptional regulator TrmB